MRRKTSVGAIPHLHIEKCGDARRGVQKSMGENPVQVGYPYNTPLNHGARGVLSGWCVARVCSGGLPKLRIRGIRNLGSPPSSGSLREWLYFVTTKTTRFVFPKLRIRGIRNLGSPHSNNYRNSPVDDLIYRFELVRTIFLS